MAGTIRLILLIMMLAVRVLKHSEIMNFRKKIEVTMARSKCLVIFVKDLNPYELLLDKMEGELIKLSAAIIKVAQTYTREQ